MGRLSRTFVGKIGRLREKAESLALGVAKMCCNRHRMSIVISGIVVVNVDRNLGVHEDRLEA